MSSHNAYEINKSHIIDIIDHRKENMENLLECQKLVDELVELKRQRDEVVSTVDVRVKEIETKLLAAGFTPKKVTELLGGKVKRRGELKERITNFLSVNGAAEMHVIVDAVDAERHTVASTLQYLKGKGVLQLDKVTHLWSVVTLDVSL